MIVYLDAVLLINSVYNGMVLILLYILHSAKIRPVRLMLSAFLGGGLSLVAFVPYFQPYLSVALRYLMPFIMSFVCFFPCSIKNVMLNGIYVFLLSFFLSGALNFFGKGIAMIFILILCGVDSLKRVWWKKYRETVLEYGEKSVSVQGFCDSGNLLEYKGVPVILANRKIFENLFGDGFDIFMAYKWIDEEDFRYIPYTSLGKNGVIPGIVMDRAVVSGKVFEKVILGYSGSEFSEKVILSSSMI